MTARGASRGAPAAPPLCGARLPERFLGAVEKLDSALWRRFAAARAGDGGLTTVLFHRILAPDDIAAPYVAFGHAGTTSAHLRQVIEHFLENGYELRTPGTLLGRGGGTRIAMITFDDGYADNLRALPILAEYRVPAIFFVSAGPIEKREMFWWDALARRERRLGAPDSRIRRTLRRLASLETDEIRERVLDDCGAGAFRPDGDPDRPMTPEELRSLAASPWAEIGNHGYDHGVMAGRPASLVREELGRAQEALQGITGIRPAAVAYPHGRYDRATIAAAAAAGLRVGFTVERRRTCMSRLDPGSAEWLSLGRIPISGRRSLVDQLESFQSPASLARRLHQARAIKNRVAAWGDRAPRRGGAPEGSSPPAAPAQFPF